MIGWVEHHRLKAVVAYTDFYGQYCQIHVGSENDWRVRRKFLWATFHYPFIQLNLKWILGVVAESNKAAYKFDTHVGFEELTRLPDGNADGDDLIFLKMHRNGAAAQRWLALGERYGQRIATASA
jgi:hypothetical protein